MNPGSKPVLKNAFYIYLYYHKAAFSYFHEIYITGFITVTSLITMEINSLKWRPVPSKMAKVGAANLQFYAAQCSQQEMTY